MADLFEILNNQPQDSSLNKDIDSLSWEGQLKTLENQRYRSNTFDRRWLAFWSAFIVTVWLGIVLLILFFNEKSICLSDSVLITLLTTTTINVLGLMLIVLRGHFNLSK